MSKVNVLIDLFFKELPSWEERCRAVLKCGYKYIETWQGNDPAKLKELVAAGTSLVSIVMNGVSDEKVAPIRSENLQRFLDRVDEYADNALAASCKQGIVTTGQTLADRDRSDQRAALIEALHAAGDCLSDRNFKLNLEPLNTTVNHRGYYLDDPAEAVAIVEEINLPNVRLLYDIYHMGIMSGNQTAFIEKNIKWIGHFHIAGIPGRHEPLMGETNYPFLLDRIKKSGYDGFFGLEYHPALPSAESLNQTFQYLNQVVDY